MRPTLAKLRQFIVEHFNREELDLICSDHFHDFYADHLGMTLTNTTLAQKLVEYCERRSQLSELKTILHNLRPEPYGKYFDHVRDTFTNGHDDLKDQHGKKFQKIVQPFVSQIPIFIGILFLAAALALYLGLTNLRPPKQLSSTIASMSLPANDSCHFQRPTIPQRLVIPVIFVDTDIIAVGTGKLVTSTLSQTKGFHIEAPRSKAVGWHDYSGRLGESKNVVLNGHNNIYGSVFLKLYTLKRGDDIYLQANDIACHYQVQEVLILLERDQPLEIQQKNSQYIRPMSDERVTLISSWPETSNTHAVVVIAKPVETSQVISPASTPVEKNPTKQSNRIFASGLPP